MSISPHPPPFEYLTLLLDHPQHHKTIKGSHFGCCFSAEQFFESEIYLNEVSIYRGLFSFPVTFSTLLLILNGPPVVRDTRFC